MKITDLRIGNIVKSDYGDDYDYDYDYDYGMMKVDTIISNNERVYTYLLSDEENSFVDYPLSFLKPVPITEEWLVKLRFIKTVDTVQDSRLRQFELNGIELIHGCTVR